MQEKEKNEFAQEKLQNDLEKLQIDFDIVNSKWQTEISKVAKILLENTVRIKTKKNLIFKLLRNNTFFYSKRFNYFYSNLFPSIDR